MIAYKAEMQAKSTARPRINNTHEANGLILQSHSDAATLTTAEKITEPRSQLSTILGFSIWMFEIEAGSQPGQKGKILRVC